MKPLLTILILLPCFCFGQKKDSLTENVIDSARWIGLGTLSDSVIAASGTITMDSSSFGRYGINHKKTDTIPVLILLCDTTEQGLFRSNRYAYFGIKTNGFAMWMFGYEVTTPEEYNHVPNPNYLRENTACLVFGCTANHSDKTIKQVVKPSYKILIDQNLKPLPKSIVVWMSKQIP